MPVNRPRGKSNAAVKVYGAKRIDRRAYRITQFKTYGFDSKELRDAIRALIDEAAKRIPVETGRLYRSLKVKVTRTSIELRYVTPYANRVNLTSKRNARYIQRGLRYGVARANRILRGTGISLRRVSVERYGYGRVLAVVGIKS